MREHNAFGTAGCAGRVDNSGQILFGRAGGQLAYIESLSRFEPLVDTAVMNGLTFAFFLFGCKNNLLERRHRCVGIENGVPTGFCGGH